MLYTSDGRDVEMSVASTKAFYAQVAAGFLLALRARRASSATPTPATGATSCSPRCASCPTRWREVLDRRGRDRRGRAALRARRGATGPSSATAPTGSPPHELRIKLSELCYKSIACDVTEDKKHIDLSSEPLILVCAAGLARLERRRRRQGGRDLPRPQGRADRDRRPRARRASRAALDDDRGARRCTRRSRSCSSAMAGHLFGYEAALAIDASARPLREARGRDRGRVVAAGVDRRRPARSRCGRRSSRSRPRFFDGLRTGALRRPPRGRHRGAARVAAPLRDRASCRSTRTRSSSARSARPSVVVDDLTAALTAGDRGAHPPDRRDQAPGQDGHRRHLPLRRDAAAGRRWCSEVLAAGAPRDSLSYRALRTLVALDPAVDEVARLHPLPHRGRPRRPTTPRSTSSTAAASRATSRRAPTTTRALRGTKHRVATEREVTVARGPQRRPHAGDRPRGEGQPDRPGSRCCTSRFADRLPGRRRPRACSQGYRGRYARPARRGHRDRADVRRRRARRRSTSSTCSPSRSYVLADRWRDRRCDASLGICGIGTDLVEIERFRLALRTARVARRPPVHRRRAAYASEHHDPATRLAARFAAKEAVMKALGVGLGTFAFRDVEVVRDDDSGAPSLALHGAAAALADDARRHALAAVAHPHRHHGDGGRCSRSADERVEPVLTPEAMAAADAAHDRGRHAGRRCSWSAPDARSRGRCAARCRGVYGRRVGGGVRQGQQRRRRPGRGAACSSGWGVARRRVRARRRRRPAPRSRARSASADVVVDAMYGTGFRGALDGDAAWVAEQLADWPGDGGRGRHPVGRRRAHRCGAGAAVRADPHGDVRGAQARARVRARPFARRARSWSPTSASTSATDGADAPAGMRAPRPTSPRGCPRRAPDAHKWESGVLVVGGSGGMTGAPMLVSHAAMRAGAGIVWCALPGSRRGRSGPRAPR